MEAELTAFLEKHTKVLDAGTTTALLSGYGQSGLLEVFAASRGDHETVLELLVQRGQAGLLGGELPSSGRASHF